jgi:PAS domain S-box-containing protein
VWLGTANPPEVLAPALIGITGWASLFMLRKRYTRYMPHTIVFAVMAAACIAVLAFGSVRTAASFLFVAVVAGAGVLLGRSALIATVGISSAVLGGLTIAEHQGWLHAPNFGVGLTVWLTHTATLLVVAILVFYSRGRSEQALQRLQQELALRQRTEQERDRSLDRFVRIFRNSPSPMLAQSARNGMILDVNPAFERCYGYAREQLLGRPDTMLWASHDDRMAYLDALTEHRRTERVPARGLRADGSVFDALVSSEMSDDPGDRLVITTVIDVSEQNAAMERLKRSEERFAKAFNFSPLKMTITRLSDGTFIEVNQARDPVQGLERGQLVGKSTLDTGGWLSPQERQTFIELIQRDGYVSGYETRMRHADGQVVDAKMWAEIIEIDGEDCILSCFVNTTAEKRREAQLLSLTRGMAGPSGDALFQALTLHMAQAIGADMVTVGELRPDGRVQTLAVWKDGRSTPNFDFVLGPSPCQDTLAQPTLNFVGAGLLQRYPNCEPLRVEGFEAYIGQSLRDEDGSPMGLINAFWRRPVTLPDDARALIAIFASRANAELVRLRRDREIQRLNSSLEQRVRERTAELQKLNAELDSFAYSVSHDLKSPLRAIAGFTQLLQESLDDRLQPDERDTMARVLAATQRMAKLIADLLALARISQGPLTLSRVDLSTMALQILQAAQQRQPARALHWRVSPGLHAWCDERLLRIALENLVDNAVKYTRDQAEPLIEFGQLDAPSGQTPVFFIRDNGSGFDMAHADKLFKPFQRLHMPSSGYEGTGIGLATVRRIVERHGGAIHGTAQPDAGAQFCFTLQRATAALVAPSAHETDPA